MGLKDAAKKLMAEAGVPTTPGYLGEDQSEERLQKEADAIGYPVLIKATAGGGGKGMRKVEKKADFKAALQSAKREAAPGLQRQEPAAAGCSRRLLDCSKPVGQEPLDDGRRGGHGQDVVERHLARPRELAARRHQRAQHQGHQVAPRREGLLRHERLRIIPSALWRATAWIDVLVPHRQQQGDLAGGVEPGAGVAEDPDPAPGLAVPRLPDPGRPARATHRR